MSGKIPIDCGGIDAGDCSGPHWERCQRCGFFRTLFIATQLYNGDHENR